MTLLEQDSVEKYRKISEKLIDPLLLSKLRSLFERSVMRKLNGVMAA